MKVRLAVHGRFHAFDLAASLHRHGALEAVHTTYPRFIAKRWLGTDIKVISEPWLEARRRFAQRVLHSHCQDVGVATAFARAVARSIVSSDADILVGWSGASLEAIAPAQARGLKVVIERGSSHIDHQARVLSEAFAKAGITAPAIDPVVAARERAEYEAADAICVPSELAAQSFVDAGVPREKMIVNPLGVDAVRFHLADRPPRNARPRVLCSGNVGIRKGAPTLITASEKLQGAVEVVFAGPIGGDIERPEPGALAWVHFAGAVPNNDMPERYRQSDIFCLPSIEEGFGMAVLEAMASGLPVVVSDRVGACDLVQNGVCGFIVPADDPDALAARLYELAEDEDKRLRMGQAARRIAERHGWLQTGARAIEAYRRLID